jgi:hypothetical protein
VPEYYEIRVEGHLDQCWSDWFESVSLTHLEGSETLLSGALPDQAALHGLLEQIRDLNITLNSIARVGAPTQQPDQAQNQEIMQKTVSVSGTAGTLGQPAL